MLPVAASAVIVQRAARYEHAVWRNRRPMDKSIGQPMGEWFQRLFGSHLLIAVARSYLDACDAEIESAVLCAHGALTFAARPSRKSFTRAFASGALCAMAASRPSVKKP